jgi:hypothetical protein
MRRAFPALIMAAAVWAVLPVRYLQAQASLGDLLARVGESVTRYYSRAQNIICLESIRLMSLESDMTVGRDSLPRRLEYELRVEWDPAAEGEAPPASVVRQLLRVNGRVPKPKDEPGCLDPASISPEPLAMLLPSKQNEFSWSIAGPAKVSGRAATMVDYKSKSAGKISASLKQKDCFSIDLAGHYRGRVWIDNETADVLRIDERLDGMHDVTLPRERRKPIQEPVTIERHDTSIRYHAVAFNDPDEILMLPASIESYSVIRGSGTPRVRTLQEFSKYRRFVTSGRIVQ